MLDEIFTWLTMAMSERFFVALLASFGWGVASILLSPCHLASIPLVVGYIGSQDQEEMRRPYVLSLVFGVGILITIALVGVVTASAGRMMGDIGFWGNLIVAGIFFVMGLYLIDVVSLSWGCFALRTGHLRGWKGALFLGLVIGVGLGPCTFAFMAPVLGVVFSVASNDPLRALGLLAAFGIGHCAVIVGAGGSVGAVQRYLAWSGRSRSLLWMKRGAGVLVILAGVYFVTTAF